MLEEIINNLSLHHYLTTFEKGKTIFLEGDPSQDLYILVSGRLDVLKGNKEICEISEIGTLLGEIPLLLDTKRTATVKTRNEAKTLRIPKEDD